MGAFILVEEICLLCHSKQGIKSFSQPDVHFVRMSVAVTHSRIELARPGHSILTNYSGNKSIRADLSIAKQKLKLFVEPS